MKSLFKIGFCFVVMSLSYKTMAGADCPKAPKDQWLSVFDMQKKIINEYGLAIKKFKVDGHCYEIYGWEKKAGSGEQVKVEVYFNPVTAEIVKKEVD